MLETSLILLMELNHYIKKNRDTYIVNNKPYKNLGNYGALPNTIVTMSRNGEYYGISLQLLNRVYPLFNSWHIKQILININSNYANNYILIEKFNLQSYYTEFGNDIFKFIVNHFMVLNELPFMFSDVNMPNLYSHLKTLVKHIELNCHDLIPTNFIVLNGGSLLPIEWIGKEFKNGNDFHRAIDQLENRINKPPVTYLANYQLTILKQNNLTSPFNKLCEKSLNIFLHDNFKWSYHMPINVINLTVKSELITINGKRIKLNLIYDHNKIFIKSDVKQTNQSIGYNCSLLQKSIRRGNVKTLIEALTNLRYAKPYNNPELNYKLVTGSRQLVWRLFITIIEDVALYKSENHLDIFDLVLFTKLCNNVDGNLVFSNDFFNKLIQLGTLICQSNKVIDFREYNGKHIFNPLNKTLLGLYIAETEPGMKGDKIMINMLKSVSNYYDLDNPNININNSYKSDNLTTRLASIDHHCYPPILILLQQLLPDKKITECATILWEESSKLNYRKHNMKNMSEIQKKILLVQYNVKDHFIKLSNNKSMYLSNNYQEMLTVDNYFYKICMAYNNTAYCVHSSNTQNKNRLLEQLVYSSTLNGFNFLGRKIYPIYTITEIKFKIGDKIINMDDPEYSKIFTYYHNNKTNKCLKDVSKKYGLTKNNDGWSFCNSNVYIGNNDYINDYISSILTDEDNDDKKYKILALSKLKYGIKKKYINTNVLTLIKKNELVRLHGKVMTTDTDKNGNDIIILNKIDRLGHSTDSNVDDYQGTIKTLLDILCLVYPCFIKLTDFKYKINKLCTSYDDYLSSYHQIISNTNNNLTSTMNITTNLWSHQEYITKNIMNLITNYGVTGFGDASQVGSGKTLTALNVINHISKLDGALLNYLILVPNDNLYMVWKDEVYKHTSGCNIHFQEQNGKYVKSNSNGSNNSVNIYVTTMAKNRDYFDQFNVPIDLVIVDECLTVQNKDTKWTIKAFMSVSRAKFGVLMLSATFFRTRFDKLLFMLKMLNTGLPERQEYLDTILNTAINLNIKTTNRIWQNNIIRIDLPVTLSTDYTNAMTISDSKMKYIKCKEIINRLDWLQILLTVSRHLVSLGKKVLCYVDSQNDIDKLKTQNNNDVYIYDKTNDEVINKNICVISKYRGTYGINNLVDYDTIVLRPIESDKIPQIKGRLDRPGQKSKNLEINFIIVNKSIEELDITKIDIANNFYNSHILPIAIINMIEI